MDALNKISDFVDQNIQIVRYGSPIVATAGIILILRHTHAFTVFHTANSIPAHIVERNSTIRGITKAVTNSRCLKIQHLPILCRNLEKRKKYFGQKVAPIDVAIAGIIPKQGCHDYLQKNLLHQNAKIIPLQVNAENCLEAIIYAKKGIFRSICINKELVAKGLAVTHHDKNLSSIKRYAQLTRELLSAEIQADKKGLGVWKRPSIKERLHTWWKKFNWKRK